VVEAGDIVGDFRRVIEGDAGEFIQLEQQEIGREDWVPSIWDESTASRRTYM
jgi:hypothetical protein